MRKAKILNIIALFILIAGCSQPNFFVGGGQSLDLEAPKLTLLTPANFSFVPANFSVEGIVTDNVGVEEVVVIISGKDGEKVKTCNAAISGDKFKADITDFPSGEYSVVVNAYDEARNTSTTSSKSISITVDAGSSSLTLRKPLLFSSLSEDVLNSKKFHVYADLDYFKNEKFEFSGTVEEDYGVGALTLQLEFVGSNEEGALFDASESNPIVWNYRVFRKNGEYYYNNGSEDVSAQDLFSGSLNNFSFKIDSSKILIDGSPLDYNLKHYFKVRIIAEKKTVPVENFDFYPGYLCIYPKSDEPWVVPSFVEGTSFSAGSSIFGEVYDDDGVSEKGIFYCIAAKDKPQPKLEDFTAVGNGTIRKNVLTWKIDLQKDILPGNYKLWYYAVDETGVFPKESKDSSEPVVSCLEFLVPDPGQPISEVEMFTGTDKTKKASEYPADSTGNFLLAGSAYDTSEVQAVIFAWVPQGTDVPNWKNTDLSDNIGEDWSSNGAFIDGVKYWRIPLGESENTTDGRKRYDISLQLNDRSDFILENGTVEYSNKYFYIFTKGADDAEGNKKFTIINFTVPKDLMPPEVEVTQPSSDNTENDTRLPVNFKISAFDNENIVDKVYINAAGMTGEKEAILQSDGSWEVAVDSSDFVESQINEVKKFIVTAQDLYGNKKQSIRSLKIKNTSIPVSKITSDENTVNVTKSNGEIEIYVIADDVITNVTGQPRLKLNVANLFGSKSVYAEYKEYSPLSSESGKTQLVFVYTISDGDAASPLNVEALELNGGIISNAAGNGISGNIPVSGANSLRNRNIIIDTTAPQIQSIITSVPKGAYGKGSKIDIIISFDRVLGTLNSSGTSFLVLNTEFGGKTILFDSTKVSVSGNTAVFNYEVSDGENSENLDVLRFENSGMIADERGNKPTAANCEEMLAGFREIIVDTKLPEIVSYGVNGISGKKVTDITYDTNVKSKIEIEFNESVMKNSGSILLERVYKSYPAVITNEEKASYESIRSFSGWDTYYINRCIGTVNNNGVEPDREGKWVLKYNYKHGAYASYSEADKTDSIAGDGVGALWNYFADVNAASNECLDYNSIRIDVNSGLVVVDGKKVTITPPNNLPEGIMFCVNVGKGVFLDRANNENAESKNCKFETVNAASPVIRINKLSGRENDIQPKSTTFKISSETYNASYYYGLASTTNSGDIPSATPNVSTKYFNAVSIGENNSNAYVYKIFAKTENGTGRYSSLTKELAFKTVISGLDDGAFGSDSTGGPASTTEFPLEWGKYVKSTSSSGYMSQATSGILYSWHIIKDFQYKSAKNSSKYADESASNTSGLAGAKCVCGQNLTRTTYTVSASYDCKSSEALYFAFTNSALAVKGVQSGNTWTTILSSTSSSSFYVYKGPASLGDSVSTNDTSLVRSTSSFSTTASMPVSPKFPTAETLTATYTCDSGEALYFTGDFSGAENSTIAFKGTLTGTNKWTFDTYGFTGMKWKVLKGSSSLGNSVEISGSSLTSMKGTCSYPIISTVPVFPVPVTLEAIYSGEGNIYFSGKFHGAENGSTAIKGTQNGNTWTVSVTSDTDTFTWYVLKGKNSSASVSSSSLLKMNESARTAPTVVSISNPTFPEGRIAVKCTNVASNEAVYFAGNFDDGSSTIAKKGTKSSTGEWYLDVSYGTNGHYFTWSVYKGSSSYSSAAASSLTAPEGSNLFTGVGTKTVTFASDITLTVTSNVDWIWDANAYIYAWVWGGTYGDGKYVLCSKASTTSAKLVIDAGGCTGFKLVRRQSTISNLTTWTDDIWNQTNDITYSSSSKTYSTSWIKTS